MTWIETIILFLQGYPILSGFLAGFLAEELLVILGFLAGQDIIPFWIVFFSGLLGIFCIDSLYFLFGRIKKFHNPIAKRINSSRYSKIAGKIGKLTNNNKFFSLFLSKFIYGPRMIIIIYFAFNNMPYRKFVFYEISALLLWASLVMPLAWLAGIGVLASLDVVKRIERIFIFSIIFSIVIYIIFKSIFNKLTKKYSKNSN